jgi:hypothetical protein
VNLGSSHVSSDRLGDAARSGLDCLREDERGHVRDCQECSRLFGGYRLADRLLSAPWSEVKVPAGLVQPVAAPSVLGKLPALGRFNPRTLAPGLAALAILALVGATFAVPRLLPASPSGTHTPVAVASASPGGASHVPSPSVAASSASASASSPVPSVSATPSASIGSMQLSLARVVGTPIAWSPDGGHLLLWSQSHVLQIRDASGRLTGTVAADAAVWVSSSTIAISVRTPGSGPAAASPSPTRPGNRHGPGNSAGSNPGGGSKPGSVRLVNVGGAAVTTLPAGYAPWSGLPNITLAGSGTGQFTVANQTGTGGSGWQFVLWNGSAGAVSSGLPIAFSRDGSRLAVLQPTGAGSGVVAGSLTILSVPSLSTLASFPNLVLRLGPLDPAAPIDAQFSPDSRSLLVAGALVDLSKGSTVATGDGGWLANGTLVTSSSSGLLRWSGTTSTLDSRFTGAGSVSVDRQGDLVYVFADGRPPLLLQSGGQLDSLGLPGVRAISNPLISPSGRSVVLGGRATNGSPITVVAALP